MATTVRLTVLSGLHKGRRFCFRGAACCQIGRASDCLVQLTGTEKDQFISRYHCQLDIDPPSAKITDLQSSNGTFINGKKVEPGTPEVVAIDGDMITIGGTTLRIDMLECPFAETEAVWGPDSAARKDCGFSC